MIATVRSLVLPSVVGAALVGGAAFAQQPSDALKQFQAQQSLVQQKIEADVQTAITEALKLQGTSDERAIRILKAKLDGIKTEPALSDDQRKPLIVRLNAQIKAIENKEQPKVNSDELTKRKEVEEQRAKAVIEEVKDVRLQLESIRLLVDKNEMTQAKKIAEALFKKYPNNPAAIALSQSSITAESIKEAKLVAAQMNEGFLLAMRSVDKSAIMPSGDITFNKEEFTKLVAKRKGNTLTAKEKVILKALDKEDTFNFTGQSLEEVLNKLSESLSTPIVLDEIAKSEMKIDSNTTVTANLKNVTTRTALRKVLQDKGLAFVMKNEMLYVTSAEKAKHLMVSRVYYVGDLVTGLGPFNAVRSGPFADQRQTQEMVDQLQRAILAVDPLSWEKANNGGHGTVAFHWPSMSFIVRQSAEVHAKLGGSLGGGK